MTTPTPDDLWVVTCDPWNGLDTHGRKLPVYPSARAYMWKMVSGYIGMLAGKIIGTVGAILVVLFHDYPVGSYALAATIGGLALAGLSLFWYLAVYYRLTRLRWAEWKFGYSTFNYDAPGDTRRIPEDQRVDYWTAMGYPPVGAGSGRAMFQPPTPSLPVTLPLAAVVPVGASTQTGGGQVSGVPQAAPQRIGHGRGLWTFTIAELAGAVVFGVLSVAVGMFVFPGFQTQDYDRVADVSIEHVIHAAAEQQGEFPPQVDLIVTDPNVAVVGNNLVSTGPHQVSIAVGTLGSVGFAALSESGQCRRATINPVYAPDLNPPRPADVPCTGAESLPANETVNTNPQNLP